MRKLLFFLILTSMACSAASEPPIYTGDLPKNSVKFQFSEPTLIVAPENGLRLRDRPDATGSQELVIMPKGAVFDEYYKISVNGVDWSFGVYTDENNIHWLGYCASRYLEEK